MRYQLSEIRDDTPKGIKILFSGLDNAGKTSIILTLSRDFSKIAILKPTKEINRRIYDFLGMTIGEWDLGGQRLYRKMYLNKADQVFGRTEILLYVLDIQDIARYDEAFEYLQDIITAFNELEITPQIYVLFHKFDPVDMIGSQSEITNQSLALRDRIKNELQYPKIEFYRTSIFDLHAILRVMSKILLSKIPRTKALETSIKEFSEQLNLEGLELIDDNSLILSSYYKNKNIQKILNAVSPFFLEVNDTFERVKIDLPYGDEEPEDKMVVQRFGKHFLFKKFRIKKGGPLFYLLTCKSDPDFDDKDFDTFLTLIKQILDL